MEFFDAVIRPLLPTFIFLLAPFLFLYFEHVPLGKMLEKLNLRRSDVGLGGLWEGVKLFVLLYLILVIESMLLSYFHAPDLDKVSSILVQQHILVLLAAATITPIAEEVFFRGYLQSKFGAVLSALAFGGLHYVYGSTYEVVFAISVGLLFGWYVRKQQKLLPVIFAHAAFNSMSVYFLLNPVG